MAWPQSYRSATSVQIQFFLFFVNCFSLLWNSYRFFFLCIVTFLSNEIPLFSMSYHEFQNILTKMEWRDKIVDFLYYLNLISNEIDFMKLIWLKLSLK
jgi:hypothetical protein